MIALRHREGGRGCPWKDHPAPPGVAGDPKGDGPHVDVTTILDAVLKVLNIVLVWLNIRDRRRRDKEE